MKKNNKNIVGDNFIKISIKYREWEREYNIRVDEVRKNRLKETDTKKIVKGGASRNLG